MTPDDQTDQALAALAGDADHDDAPATDETSADLAPDDAPPMQAAASDDDEDMFATDDVIEHEAPATAPEAESASDVDGYTRHGPGPLDAIRFRWTARRADDGRYYVDETIGQSRPISTGPMPADEIVAFIDAREHSARERFDELKSEMTLARHDRPHRIAPADSEEASSDT